MFKRILSLLLACMATVPLRAQIMVTDMGTVMYYNSLDSTKTAILNHIASRAWCLLQYEDSAGIIHFKLDLDLSRDSMYYFLGYNNLAGTADSFPDSTLATAGRVDGDLGIYIRARDSILDEDKILRLIDYGVRNNAYLQALRLGAAAPGPQQIEAIFRQKMPQLKRLIASCK